MRWLCSWATARWCFESIFVSAISLWYFSPLWRLDFSHLHVVTTCPSHCNAEWHQSHPAAYMVLADEELWHVSTSLHAMPCQSNHNVNGEEVLMAEAECEKVELQILLNPKLLSTSLQILSAWWTTTTSPQEEEVKLGRNGGGLALALAITTATWPLCRIIVVASSSGSLLSVDRTVTPLRP